MRRWKIGFVRDIMFDAGRIFVVAGQRWFTKLLLLDPYQEQPFEELWRGRGGSCRPVFKSGETGRPIFYFPSQRVVGFEDIYDDVSAGDRPVDAWCFEDDPPAFIHPSSGEYQSVNFAKIFLPEEHMEPLEISIGGGRYSDGSPRGASLTIRGTNFNHFEVFGPHQYMERFYVAVYSEAIFVVVRGPSRDGTECRRLCRKTHEITPVRRKRPDHSKTPYIYLGSTAFGLSFFDSFMCADGEVIWSDDEERRILDVGAGHRLEIDGRHSHTLFDHAQAYKWFPGKHNIVGARIAPDGCTAFVWTCRELVQFDLD